MSITTPHGLCRLAPVRGGRVDWPAGYDIEVQSLTGRQTAILRYIADHIADRGYPPTFREIVAAVGMRSTGSLRYQIRRLEDKGLIERPSRHGQRASLRLVRPEEVAR
ncbi:hypothetical protein K1W54_04840 [Micromonospora sp. CPCC 205371]|nr:hypothetical protein [Micromonospora sp. CPCC 205371]